VKLAFKFSSICGKGFEVILYGTSMVKEMVITKVSIRDRLIVDLKVIMSNPRDYDFSPRAEVNGTTLSVTNEGDETLLTTFELNSEMMQIVERDRMVELRIKFNVEGMHGVLLNKTTNSRDGPKSKKLAQPSWKTVLPLDL
jgi:hypothetical protein|tara:strand:- start:5661 stop:6083 length:423 start_codon:yes stop_codon:yes gene_type:complete